MAKGLRFIKRGDLSKHQRVIGSFTWRNKRYGTIQSPQLDKEVTLFFSRLIEREATIPTGSLLVFNPIISSKNANELFAFFAYPLEQEQDITFLKQQFANSHLAGIQAQIDLLLQTQPASTPEQQFEEELTRLGPIQSTGTYQQLVTLIQRFKQAHNFLPSLQLLQQQNVPATYLLQLWENKIIQEYDADVMNQYFLRSPAIQKRSLLTRLKPHQRHKVLTFYLERCLSKGPFNRMSNDLKTLLDLVYRNKDTRDQELYDQVYDALQLPAAARLKLWLKGYIHKIEDEVFEHAFDYRSQKAVKEALANYDERLTSRILNYYENRLLSFIQASDEDVALLELAYYTILFHNLFRARFQEIFPDLLKVYSALQRFVLWLFALPVEMDAVGFFDQHHARLNPYFLVRYCLQQRNHAPDQAEVAQASLSDFAASFPWDCQFLSPTERDVLDLAEDEILLPQFLPDVQQFDSRIDLPTLATVIFEVLPKYQGEHIRLWIRYHLLDELLDFVGFREVFKELNREDKIAFKARVNALQKYEVEELEQKNYVRPCTDFQQEEGYRIYTAFAENIFFRFGSLRLKLEDKSYTLEYADDLVEAKSSTGLNRLPVDSIFNKIPIRIRVEEGTIVQAEDLEHLFNLIQASQINWALGSTSGSGSSAESIAYAEDWQLRKQVLDYLNETSIAHKLVVELTDSNRRKERDSGEDKYEKTMLYTLEAEDGFAIVWENIDFTEDRSTYVFKTTAEHQEEHLQELAKAISSYSHLRSTLSVQRTDPDLLIFRDHLGFITSLRKKRGRNLPFKDWHARLQDAIQQPIPPVPSPEEWASVERMPIKSGTNRVPSVTRVQKINLASLATMNPDTFTTKSSSPEPTTPNPSPEDLTQVSLLDALVAFNKVLLTDLSL